MLLKNNDTDPKMFQMLHFMYNFGYISNFKCKPLLTAKIILLERISNSQKFGPLLTLTFWMVILHVKEQKQQLTNQIKQFSDVLYLHFKYGKEIIFIKKKSKLNKKQQKTFQQVWAN